MLLSPLLEVVESLVGKPGKGGEAGWDGLQLSDLLKMARLADEEHQGDGAGRGMSSIAEGVKSLLESLLLLWDSFCSLSAGDVPIDVATGFHNQSSNKLMGMVAVVLGRRVTHEAQSVWRKRMADWRALAQALGLGGPGLPVTLSPSNKALLAYLRNAADVGEKKVSLKVRPERKQNTPKVEVLGCLSAKYQEDRGYVWSGLLPCMRTPSLQ